jgi:galactose mutarotase-like enzyme
VGLNGRRGAFLFPCIVHWGDPWVRALVSSISAALVAFPCAAGAARPTQVAESQLVRLTLPGGKLQAHISPTRGAELVGLEVRRNRQWSELLYRGMDFRPTDGWAGRAPILWPAVGRNYSNPPPSDADDDALTWTHNGITYPIAIHGFARELPWRLVSQGVCNQSAFVQLTLRDNATSRRSYPFGFELDTEYRLWKSSLYIRQSVRSDPLNKEPMPFSIGNHITLALPLVPGSEPGATIIATPATWQVITDRTGRPTGQVIAVNYRQPRRLDSLQPLTPISLSGYPDGLAWARLTDPTGFALTISHREERRPNGVPVLFNLWGDPAHGYFAPEPWVGKQNSLASGDGIIALSPGDTFHWTLTVSISNDSGASNGNDAPASLSWAQELPTCH